MSESGDKNRRNGTASTRGLLNARQLALVGMEALANYQEAGLAAPRETLHKQLAVRLARVAATSKWG